MKKKDVLLIGIVLVVAAVLFLVFAGMKSGSGNVVQITIDGELYGPYRLSEDRTIAVEELGHNVIQIADNKVTMTEADCPDQYCEEHRAISKTHEVIVCLPHKLVVEILDGGEDNQEKEQFDVVAK